MSRQNSRKYAPHVHLAGEIFIYDLFIIVPVETNETIALVGSEPEYNNGNIRIILNITDGHSPHGYAYFSSPITLDPTNPSKNPYHETFDETKDVIFVEVSKPPKYKSTTYFYEKHPGRNPGINGLAELAAYLYLTDIGTTGKHWPFVLVVLDNKLVYDNEEINDHNSKCEVIISLTNGSPTKKIIEPPLINDHIHIDNIPKSGITEITVINSDLGIVTGGKKTKTTNRNADDKPAGFK
jgi:hypothetical protein